jgi:hypothetical protein
MEWSAWTVAIVPATANVVRNRTIETLSTLTEATAAQWRLKPVRQDILLSGTRNYSNVVVATVLGIFLSDQHRVTTT